MQEIFFKKRRCRGTVSNTGCAGNKIVEISEKERRMGFSSWTGSGTGSVQLNRFNKGSI